MRTPIWTLALVLVAGGALAAPSLDAPERAARVGAPTVSETGIPSDGQALEALEQALRIELGDEGIQLARKERARRGGGRAAPAPRAAGASRGAVSEMPAGAAESVVAGAESPVAGPGAAT